MVTITDAKVTPDLREATLYYTVYGDDAGAARQRGGARERQGRAAQDRRPADRRALHAVADLHRRRRPRDGRQASRSCSPRRAPRTPACTRSPRAAQPAGEADPYRAPRVVDEDDDGRTTTRRWTPSGDAASPAGRLGGRRRACCRSAERGRAGRATSARRRRARLDARARRRAARRAASRSSPRGAASRSRCRRRTTSCPRSTCSSPPEQFPAAPELLVTLDTGSADRLGSLGRPGRRPPAAASWSTTTRATPATAALNLVDDERRSHRRARRRAARPARRAADAGDRRRRSTPGWSPTPARSSTPRRRPPVHALAARLLATGHPARPHQPRASRTPRRFGYVQLLGAACARAQLDAGAVGGLGLVWTASPADDLDRGRARARATSRASSTSCAPRGEARGRGRAQGGPGRGRLEGVDRAARAPSTSAPSAPSLGGGGHRFAAGFTATDDGTLRALDRPCARRLGER